MDDYGIRIDPQGFIKSNLYGNTHTFQSAMQEFVHNSIDAQATKIFIIKDINGVPIIIDNGKGMNENDLENLTIIHKHKYSNNSIGKYGIGLKEAIFALGGKWIILTKTTNSEDLYYSIFDIQLAKQYIEPNFKSTDKIIKSGIAPKLFERKYKNILSQLQLIDINSDEEYKNYSGTILIQNIDTNNIINTDSDDEDNDKNIEYNINNNNFNKLFNELQIKLIHSNTEIYKGIYKENNSNTDLIIINKQPKIINKFNWFSKFYSDDGSYIKFIIKTYYTNNNKIRFVINYNNINYRFIKKTQSFVILNSTKEFIDNINIQFNIINNKVQKQQEKFYKLCNYKGNINGIIISRNNLDLYTFPNEFPIINNKKGLTKYCRCYITYVGDSLDYIFGIKTNKSLFNISNINTTFDSCISIIHKELYNVLSIISRNELNLNYIFNKIFNNNDKIIYNTKSNYIVNKIVLIKNKFYHIYNLTKINNPDNLLDLFMNVSKKFKLVKHIQSKFRYNKIIKNNFTKLCLLLIISKYNKYMYTKYLKNILQSFYNNYIIHKKNKNINLQFYKLYNNIIIHNYYHILKMIYHLGKINYY